MVDGVTAKPDYLPIGIWSIYLDMKSRDVLSGRNDLLFTDQKLADFWLYVSSYTNSIDPRWLAGAESFIVGSILNPLNWYSQTGTADRPTLKTRIRERQRKADILFDEVAELALQLINKLDEVSLTTNYSPDEIHLRELLHPLIEHDQIKPDIATTSLLTSQLIQQLYEAFKCYPRTDKLFADIPGMSSQKSTWRDWMAETHHNLSLLLSMYGNPFEMREKHWLALVNVLIDESITRSSVSAALNGR